METKEVRVLIGNGMKNTSEYKFVRSLARSPR